MFFSPMCRLRIGAPFQTMQRKKVALSALTTTLLQQLQPTHGDGEDNYCHGKE